MESGVIVIGGHIQGLGIIRIYGENGIPSILLDETKYNIARHSKYCRRFYKIDPLADLADYLMSVLPKKERVKNWLVIPTNDKYVQILSKNKNRLEKIYQVSVGAWTVIQNCYDKRLTYKIAKTLGISIPGTILLEDIIDIEDIDIAFPCILKPAIMHKFYSQVKSKVIICYSKNDLIDKILIAEKFIPKEEIIIQEIIPGDSENQYSACFFYNIDQAVVTLEARRKRQHPPDFGNATTFAETVEIPELIETSKKFLSYIKFWGLCEVEFKYDYRDQKFKLLEINPRTWKWHLLARRSESPFLLSLYRAIYFNEPIYTDNWQTSSWRHLTTDFGVSIRQYLKGTLKHSEIRNMQRAVFDFNDLFPSVFEIIYLPYMIFTR